MNWELSVGITPPAETASWNVWKKMIRKRRKKCTWVQLKPQPAPARESRFVRTGERGLPCWDAFPVNSWLDSCKELKDLWTVGKKREREGEERERERGGEGRRLCQSWDLRSDGVLRADEGKSLQPRQTQGWKHELQSKLLSVKWDWDEAGGRRPSMLFSELISSVGTMQRLWPGNRHDLQGAKRS